MKNFRIGNRCQTKIQIEEATIPREILIKFRVEFRKIKFLVKELTKRKI
jgi:hypothetical protein